MRPHVNPHILDSCKSLAAIGKCTDKGFFASVNSKVVDELVLGAETAVEPEAPIPRAIVLRTRVTLEVVAAVFDELGAIGEVGSANCATRTISGESTHFPLTRVVARVIVNLVAAVGTVDDLGIIVAYHLHFAVFDTLDFDADLPWRRVLLDQVLQVLNCSIDDFAVDVFLIKRVQSLFSYR